jgi:hypothetical protein
MNHAFLFTPYKEKNWTSWIRHYDEVFQSACSTLV